MKSPTEWRQSDNRIKLNSRAPDGRGLNETEKSDHPLTHLYLVYY